MASAFSEFTTSFIRTWPEKCYYVELADYKKCSSSEKAFFCNDPFIHGTASHDPHQ